MKSFAVSPGGMALLGALVAGNAFSQELVSRSLSAQLAQQGMTEISEGFYGKITDTEDAYSETYVAVGAAGQEALLSTLISIREESLGTGAAKVSSKTELMRPFDELIESLSKQEQDAPGPVVSATGQGGENGPYRGNCSGVDDTNNPNNPFYLQALAGGGANGLGGSSAGVWNTDASLYTTNNAHAIAIDAGGIPIAPEQQVTTHGTTSAVASQLYANGCAGASGGSITCPGQSRPAIIVAAHGYRNKPGCNN